MSEKPVTEKMIEALKADFPPEALSKDESRGFALTSIKAAYVVERLNDVFGLFGWSYTFDPFEVIGGEVCTVVHLSVFTDDGTKTISQAGGKNPATKGGCPQTDARKSAITDGLTKCASMLGIGHTIFKGQKQPDAPQGATQPPKDSPGSSQASGSGEKMATAKQRETIGKMLGAQGYNDDADRLEYVNEVLKAEDLPTVDNRNELTSKAASKVIGKLIEDKKAKDAMANETPPEQVDTNEPF